MAHHKLPELLCHKAQWQLLWYYAVSQLAMPVLMTSISCHHKNFSKRWTSLHRQNAFASWKKSLVIVYFKFFSDPCYKQTIYALICAILTSFCKVYLCSRHTKFFSKTKWWYFLTPLHTIECLVLSHSLSRQVNAEFSHVLIKDLQEVSCFRVADLTFTVIHRLKDPWPIIMLVSHPLK